MGKMITKHLAENREVRLFFTATAAYSMDTFASPSLSGVSPFELVFLLKYNQIYET